MTKSKAAKKRSPQAAPKANPQTGLQQRETTRLGDFIRRQGLRAQPDGEPVRLVLRHLTAGNQLGQKIGSQSFSKLSEKETSSLALGIYDLAESDAIGLGKTPQRYVLLSYGEDARDPIGRCIFEVPTSAMSMDDEHPVYLDDPLEEYQRGLEHVWELLRGLHSEAFLRGAHDGFNAKMQMLKAEKARLAKEVK